MSEVRLITMTVVSGVSDRFVWKSEAEVVHLGVARSSSVSKLPWRETDLRARAEDSSISSEQRETGLCTIVNQ